jgi:cytochrome b6-f complex subunit 5
MVFLLINIKFKFLYIKKIYIYINMVEPLLSGIVLGLVPVTIAGLFVTAYLQYRRGDLASF